MSKPRRKRRKSDFSDGKQQYLKYGCVFFERDKDPGYDLPHGMVTDEVLADAEQHAADVVAEDIAESPGTRPWIWWVLHLGIAAGETFHGVGHAKETEYLEEHGLLNTRELNVLRTRKKRETTDDDDRSTSPPDGL